VNINQAEKKPIAPSAPVSAHSISRTSSAAASIGRGDGKKINIYDSFKAEKKFVDKNHIGYGLFSFIN